MALVTALVGSARARGNCHRAASLVLDRLSAMGHQTSLINLADHRVLPCGGCAYECLSRPPGCPIDDDDVPSIWKQLWHSDALIWVVPSYGGLPPAMWTALFQRVQGLGWQGRDSAVPVGIICIANPAGALAGEQTAAQLRSLAVEPLWRVAACHEFGSSAYGRKSVEIGLPHIPEVTEALYELAEKVDAALAT